MIDRSVGSYPLWLASYQRLCCDRKLTLLAASFSNARKLGASCCKDGVLLPHVYIAAASRDEFARVDVTGCASVQMHALHRG